MKTIYGVTVIINLDEIKKHCWGDCGKGIVGVITGDVIGEILPCKESVCVYEEDTMEYGKHLGEKLILRRLKKGGVKNENRD